MNLENYLHGECHLFALALHQVFGYEMVFVFDEMDSEVETEVLIHAYCKNGEHCVDARGVFEEKNALDDYDYNLPYQVDVSKKEAYSLIETGFLHAPAFGQMDNLMDYVQANKSQYETVQVKTKEEAK